MAILRRKNRVALTHQQNGLTRIVIGQFVFATPKTVMKFRFLKIWQFPSAHGDGC
jgi:hypothetical protein